jgi:hypothetical protein
MLNGGCFCGALRYETAGNGRHALSPDELSLLDLPSNDRRPIRSLFSVPRSEFRLTRGTPTRFRPTLKRMRSFCPRCGTQLTFEHYDAVDEIGVTTCTLDDPERLPPEDHTRTSSKVGWVKLSDGLPEHREARYEG